MTETFSLLFAMLTVAANVFVVGAAALALFARSAFERFRRTFAPSALTFAWFVALVATLGSLYYSEVAGFVPCKLCWYQRIAMYPLAVILAVAAYGWDTQIRRYVIPVVSIGAAISIYHYQLERFPQQASFSCTVDAPCTTVWVWHFHYISIPFMAFSAFALIATLLLLARESTPSGRAEETRALERSDA